ncbi:hypothetical protein [Actinoplanes sp. N902-109]|uniref:hypothetical protein n=1 Tax=Actinoplanes sp. (strain N902-109) TaxID=649831 RepID=UPI0003295E01|nr:hypothetical protein [Actinoplanes sp. N902-109]AGL20886.1 hypothetical protein L083_7376 [Actinoplanes sp. N902-109]
MSDTPEPDTQRQQQTESPEVAAADAAAATERRSRSARFSFAEVEPGPESDAHQRHRRRWFLGAIAAGAALVALALCAGALAVVSTFTGGDHDGDADRADRQVQSAACLELEQRLNKLVPPGATADAKARATAVTNENAALRIYLGQDTDQRTADGWRRVLDARTAYAEALAKNGPAFYVAPRSTEGRAVTDDLTRLSPAACAGPIRRLQAPDL